MKTSCFSKNVTFSLFTSPLIFQNTIFISIFWLPHSASFYIHPLDKFSISILPVKFHSSWPPAVPSYSDLHFPSALPLLLKSQVHNTHHLHPNSITCRLTSLAPPLPLQISPRHCDSPNLRFQPHSSHITKPSPSSNSQSPIASLPVSPRPLNSTAHPHPRLSHGLGCHGNRCLSDGLTQPGPCLGHD